MIIKQRKRREKGMHQGVPWDVSGFRDSFANVVVLVVVIVVVVITMRRSSYVNYYVLCLVCWILLGISGKLHLRKISQDLSIARESAKQMAAKYQMRQVMALEEEDVSEGREGMLH